MVKPTFFSSFFIIFNLGEGRRDGTSLTRPNKGPVHLGIQSDSDRFPDLEFRSHSWIRRQLATSLSRKPLTVNTSPKREGKERMEVSRRRKWHEYQERGNETDFGQETLQGNRVVRLFILFHSFPSVYLFKFLLLICRLKHAGQVNELS